MHTGSRVTFPEKWTCLFYFSRDVHCRVASFYFRKIWTDGNPSHNGSRLLCRQKCFLHYVKLVTKLTANFDLKLGEVMLGHIPTYLYLPFTKFFGKAILRIKFLLQLRKMYLYLSIQNVCNTGEEEWQIILITKICRHRQWIRKIR